MKFKIYQLKFFSIFLTLITTTASQPNTINSLKNNPKAMLLHTTLLSPNNDWRPQPVPAAAQPSPLPLGSEPSELAKSTVIPMYTGGRLGDNLLAFAHALYFALKYNYRLEAPPFLFSDKLRLHQLLPSFTTEANRSYVAEQIMREGDRHQPPAAPMLFKIPYFPEALIEYIRELWPSFKVDWEDAQFKKYLRDLITPNQPLELIYPPANMPSVAVHIRKGGGYDDTNDLRYFQRYKFPPDQYYTEQIKAVADLLHYAPLYVFLFTDDPNPALLCQQYQTAVNLPNIKFACRTAENRHDLNVLEDFFSLMNFDVLIRADSNFSIMAEKLHDYGIVVTPGDLQEGLIIPNGLIKIRYPIAEILRKSTTGN